MGMEIQTPTEMIMVIAMMLWNTFPSSKGIKAWVSWSSRYCGWVVLFDADPASQPPSLFTLFADADGSRANGLDGLLFSCRPPPPPPCPDFTELSGVSSWGVLRSLSTTSIMMMLIADEL